jgi:hypothetical protein
MQPEKLNTAAVPGPMSPRALARERVDIAVEASHGDETHFPSWGPSLPTWDRHPLVDR